MNTSRLSCALFPAALLLAVVAQAQDLSVIVVPPPEAPALTQTAQALVDAANARVPQLDTAGLLTQFPGVAQSLTAICISKAAAEPLKAFKFARRAVAAKPNGVAMLAQLAS